VTPLLYGLGRVSVRHRRTVVAAWLVVFVALAIAARSAGPDLNDNLTLPGSDSHRATDLLQARFPSQANGTNPVVLRAPAGAKLTDAKYKQPIDATVAAFKKDPDVRDATSPLDAKDILSKDARTGYIALSLRASPSDLTTDDAQRIVDEADPARDAGPGGSTASSRTSRSRATSGSASGTPRPRRSGRSSPTSVRRVFDHVTIRASDREASERFYALVLATLGIEQTYSGEDLVEWDDFSIAAAEPGEPVTRRLHIGFVAPTHELVDAFHRAGAEAGYRDDGSPGPRPQYRHDYYGSFLLDPEGNSAEAVYHGELRQGGNVDHLWVRVADVDASARFYEIAACDRRAQRCRLAAAACAARAARLPSRRASSFVRLRGRPRDLVTSRRTSARSSARSSDQPACR
jgi:catechol 2,3-dioxygenase-like lactoylglutathione lyase family enzyme